MMSTQDARKRWYAKHLGYVPGERRSDRSVGRLPNEILTRVFCFLDAPDLLMCSLVCKQWYAVASDNYVWKNLYRKTGGKMPTKTKEAGKLNYKRMYMNNGVLMRAMYIARIIEQINLKSKLKNDPRLKNPINIAVFKRYPTELCLTLFDREDRLLHSESRALTPDIAGVCLSPVFRLNHLDLDLARVARLSVALKVSLYSIAELRGPPGCGLFTCWPLIDKMNLRGNVLEVRTSKESNLRALLCADSSLLIGEWRRGGGLAFVRVAVKQSDIETAWRGLVSRGDQERRPSGASNAKQKNRIPKLLPLPKVNNTGCVELRCGRQEVFFGAFRSFEFDEKGVAVPMEGYEMSEPLPRDKLYIPWCFRESGMSGKFENLVHVTACVKNYYHCRKDANPLLWDANGFGEVIPLKKKESVDYDLGGTLVQVSLENERGAVCIMIRLPEEGQNAYVVRIVFKLCDAEQSDEKE